MATVHVTLNSINDRATTGATPDVADSTPIAAETVTSGATGTIEATSADNQFWEATVTGGNVFVAFGASPAAGENEGHLVLDGQTRAWSVTAEGDTFDTADPA